MGLLDNIVSPADVRRLAPEQVPVLAEEIRAFLIDSVCHTGGHLGPNLGVVELTLAVHRVFESPGTPVVFDTGHQSYVHKLLTGRRDGFEQLRTSGGLSGYPNRAESVHDVQENSHASTALSYADGLSRGFHLAGDDERTVVAVIGDGALTGGLAWEALNNLGTSQRRVIILLNDNGRSYSPTVGGLPRHLRRISERRGYADLVERLGGITAQAQPGQPGSLFQALGFHYLGPIDGHDTAAVEAALQQATGFRSPVVVHCLTTKGRGYRAAETDQADHLHSVGVVDALTGRPRQQPTLTWTDAFAASLVEIGGNRPEVVAVSAAMLGPTGLQLFADRYPGRCFDVGIAEQHALTSAAGLAMAGMHPVVALYATFANRAFDQLLLDVGLHQQPVTLVLDRAGVTGPDGASHHGMWDLALLGIVPRMRVAAPRDAITLSEELNEAVQAGHPTALRYPKAALGPAIPAIERRGATDILSRPLGQAEVLIIAVGAMAQTALTAAEELAEQGVACTVVDPRWALPVDRSVVELARAHRQVVTLEDGIRQGGVGSHVASRLREAGIGVPVHCLGLPTEFVAHGTRKGILASYGLDPAGVTTSILAAVDGERSSSTLLRLVTDDEAPVKRLGSAKRSGADKRSGSARRALAARATWSARMR